LGRKGVESNERVWCGWEEVSSYGVAEHEYLVAACAEILRSPLAGTVHVVTW
jgi:hypothetical protein